jgi:predicted DNA binding CopG/RHH family protein
MEKTSKAMVSRSLRLRLDTLKILKEQADLQGLGITVYIRRVLESLVENLEEKNEN